MPIVNVFGEVSFTGDDFAPLVVKNQKGPFKVEPVIGTKYGITLYKNGVKSERYYKSGFYAIQYKGKCLYVGKSEDLDRRIRRFVAGVRRTNRPDEPHAFADRYRNRYGEDFGDLEIVLFPYDIKHIEKYNVPVEAVESGIMSILGSIDNKVRV